MPALPHSSTQQFIILPVWGSSYLYVLVHLSERPEGSPSFSSQANTLGARGVMAVEGQYSDIVFVKGLWLKRGCDSVPRNQIIHSKLGRSEFYLLCCQGKPFTTSFPFFSLKISEPYKPGTPESHRGHKRAEGSATRITGGCDRQSGEFSKFCFDCGEGPRA